MQKLRKFAHDGDEDGFPEAYFKNDSNGKKNKKVDHDGILENLLNPKHKAAKEVVVEAMFEREDKEYYSELPEAKLDSEKKRNPKAFEGDNQKMFDEFITLQKKQQKANKAYYEKSGRNPGGRGNVSAAYSANDLNYIHYSEDELGIPGSTEKQLGKGRSSDSYRPGYAQPQGTDSRSPKETSVLTQTMPPMMPEYTAWSKPHEGDSNVWPDDSGETTEGRLQDKKTPLIPHKMVSKEKSRQPEAPASQYSPKVTRNNSKKR